MLHSVEGDILLTGAGAIAHGIAPNDDFKSGLALALRERFPSMVKDYRHYAHSHEPKVGGVWTWSGLGHEGRAVRIINLLTQEPAPAKGTHPGRAHLEYVNHALHALVKEIEREKITSLALPRLATGVGGLDWQQVRPLIDRHLGSLNMPIYLYETYVAGKAASEPGVKATATRRMEA